MADWESEDFDPEQGFSKPVLSDRWEGEDEEEVKDTWEDSEEEKKEEPASKAVQVKKKKTIEATLKEKEEKKQKELAEKTKDKQEEKVELSQEEQLAEKLRQQKLQEDSDLELAKETFGVTDEVRGRLDAMNPTTEEEFAEFARLLKEKLQQLEKSQHYIDFLDNLFQACSINLEADQVKRLGSNLTAIGNEKAKALKVTKSKKKGKKAVLAGSGKSGKGLGGDYDDVGYDDMDDFI